jgi:carboxymethylenebutenolidase
MSSTQRITARDGTSVRAHLAIPEHPADAVVVVVHEIEGLTPHFGDLCDRLAERGYAAIAPDLFARDPGVVEAAHRQDFPDALTRAYAIGAEHWLADIADARAHVAGASGASDENCAAVGFCFGGFVALLAATADDGDWAAAAPFYGPPAGYGAFGLPAEPAPLARADRLNCPIRMFYGRQDPIIPVADVTAFAERAGRSGHPVTIVLEDAGHAFFNDSRDTYVPPAAAHAWTQLLDFLAATLPARRSEAAS